MTQQTEETQETPRKRHYKSVSRVDYHKKKSYGWYVRVVFRGKIHAKFFSDSVWGGKRKALSEAIRFRNQLERQLGKPRTDRTVVTESPKTKTGVPGIRRTMKHTGAKNKENLSPVYEVTWSPKPGVLQRTSISIEKYGEAEAFQRALKIRQSKERLMYGSSVDRDDRIVEDFTRHSLQQ